MGLLSTVLTMKQGTRGQPLYALCIKKSISVEPYRCNKSLALEGSLL